MSRCKPARLRYQGTVYRITDSGVVVRVQEIPPSMECRICRRGPHEYLHDDHYYVPSGWPLPQTMAEHYRDAEVVTDDELCREASRLRRNRAARERNRSMRDLGMVKTSSGWE